MMETPIATLADVVSLAAECRESVVELAEDVARLARHHAQVSTPIARDDDHSRSAAQ